MIFSLLTHNLSQSKIYNPYLVFISHHYVLWFQISVKNSDIVAMIDRTDNLF
jgi:hypothetical protein